MSSEFAQPFSDNAAALAPSEEVAGFCPRIERLIVKVTGDDRIPFLHGMCSNDIKSMAVGSISYALFLTDHAHIVGDAYVWAAADALWLDVERSLWPRIREHLEKFLVADDVEMEECEEVRELEIVGRDGLGVVAALTGVSADLQPWHFATNAALMIANLPRLGVPAACVILPVQSCDDFQGRLRQAGMNEIGSEVLERLRVEAGIARPGIDTGDKTLAMEARLERGISFNKGCYVGQETVERATARGGVRKRLCGLKLAALPVPGSAEVLADGRDVGLLTSAAPSPRFGPIGLAILHNSVWPAGSQVTVKDRTGREIPAIVSDLPFS